MAQPRGAKEIPAQAQAVAEAGQRAVALGLDRARALNAAFTNARLRRDSLMLRLLQDIGTRLDPRTGVAAISSLAGMAGTLGCAVETLRRYLRRLASAGLIIKNEGNSTSMVGVSGITIALALPEAIGQISGPQPNSTSGDPPISDQTGNPIPQFHGGPGWNLSRSPTSHGALGSSGWTGQAAGLDGQGGDPLWDKPDLSLGDWIQVGVIHAEIGDHLERLADARGRGAVSRVLIRLSELRALRSTFAEIRSDVERAADIAARSLVRKKSKINTVG
jgi:hypothetical protein